MSIHPDLKTFEEFIKHYEQDTEDDKKKLYKNYLFAKKESERKKAQYQRRKERKQKEIEDMKAELETLRKQLEEKKQEPGHEPAKEKEAISQTSVKKTVKPPENNYGNVITDTKQKRPPKQV